MVNISFGRAVALDGMCVSEIKPMVFVAMLISTSLAIIIIVCSVVNCLSSAIV